MALSYITILLLLTMSSKGQDFPFKDPTLPWEERLDDLVNRLTLDEMVLQMSRGGALSNGPAPPIQRLGIGPYTWNTECLRGDGISPGWSTAFPQALGLAASFSHQLIYRVGNATATEVQAKHNYFVSIGYHGDHSGLSCFSPMLNIMRHPLWGRNQETYGEDPFLTAELAEGFVKGLQGDHPRYVKASAGCKHFDVHGGPDNIPSSRFDFDAKVEERDWRMTFLPQFEACVRAGTFSIMCSYNKINGVPACANKRLLTDILRGEWGFQGYVVSDNSALEVMMLFHRYTHSPLETAIAAVNAGCNLEVTLALRKNIFTYVGEAVAKGNISLEVILMAISHEDCPETIMQWPFICLPHRSMASVPLMLLLKDRVRPLFRTRMRLGEFDPPAMNPYNALGLKDVQTEAHRELALLAAIQSFVLLKNQNETLPLQAEDVRGKTLAVIGPFADNAVYLFGNYAPFPEPQYIYTPRRGLAAISRRVFFAAGCSSPRCEKYSPAEVKSTVQAADIIVVCLGTGIQVETESLDRPDLAFPGHQLELLQDTVAWAAGRPVILLLFNAGPLDVSWAKPDHGVGAILACFFPAQATGLAIAKVLVGADGANPAGRLPATWPAGMHQVPPMENYTMTGRTYRYYRDEAPLYPFGYGLSYTLFRYSDLVLGADVVPICGNLNLSVVVENIGPRDGEEVVQLYLRWGEASVPVPHWQLVGFRRVPIAKGQAVKVPFQLAFSQRAVWAGEWRLEPGSFTLFAGGQQPFQETRVPSNVLQTDFRVMGSARGKSQC